MEPFPEKDVLEAIDIHAFAFVELDILRRLFVLLKLGFPSCLIRWGQNAMRLPPHHTQSALGKARVTSNHHDGEDARTDEAKPGTD
jgi:hypothetical protein